MINRALKVVRQFHGLTQTEMASKLEISKSYLSEIESGKKSVTYKILEGYSSIFDIPVSSLVFFSENLEQKNSIPEKFKTTVANKILHLMEWITVRNEAKTSQE